MKKWLLFGLIAIAIIGVIITGYAFTNDDCCATCSGSKVCNACKNCKYCKHCSKEGGVCGVCSPESFEVKKKEPEKPAAKPPVKKPIKKSPK